MTRVEVIKLKAPLTKNITLKIFNQMIYVLQNINVANILFLECH